jgi:hypothetical protein
MQELTRWALQPVMRVWTARKRREFESVPLPIDTPHAHAPGVGSYRILIFGSGPAAGWGVLSHDLALPGAIARAVSARTGRDVHVDAVASTRISPASMIEQFADQDLSHYDVVVVTLGEMHAITLTSPRTWQREIGGLLRVHGNNPAGHLFIAGIPPVRSIPIFDTPWGSVADRHARALNRLTVKMCAPRPRVTFARLTAVHSATPQRHRSAADYREWAEYLTEQMLAVLDPEGRAMEDTRPM